RDADGVAAGAIHDDTPAVAERGVAVGGQADGVAQDGVACRAGREDGRVESGDEDADASVARNDIPLGRRGPADVVARGDDLDAVDVRRVRRGGRIPRRVGADVAVDDVPGAAGHHHADERTRRRRVEIADGQIAYRAVRGVEAEADAHLRAGDVQH